MEPFIRNHCRVLQLADRAVATFLAALLLVATALKIVNGSPPLQFPLSLEFIAFAEITLALFLIFHRNHVTCRLIAGAFFLVMAAFSLVAAVEGSSSCGCFGSVTVWPGWIAAIDVFGATWLTAGSSLAISMLGRTMN